MDDPITYWNDQAGPVWVAQQEQLDLLMDPLGLKLMDWAAVAEGERVLDVGCGSTSIELAERGRCAGFGDRRGHLRPDARASTPKKSPPPLAGGRCRKSLLDSPFDLIYSRFGVMFFPDPTAAFGHLRSLLAQPGRLAFVCWRPMAQNPLFHLGLEAAKSFLPLPQPSPPEAPGPFSLAPDGKIEKLPGEAGFSQVEIAAWDTHIGGTDIETMAHFLLQVGPVAPLVRQSQPPLVEQIRQRLRELLQACTGEGERAFLPASTWLVQARG